ncbi:hypothetical protein NW062_04965 [Mycoplasmopsis cynos]|nr:hypothetical protein NW062_04965 [Mycoplasmopsis cynos]
MKKYKKIFSGLGLLSITTLMGASIVACSPKEEKGQDPKAPEADKKDPKTGNRGKTWRYSINTKERYSKTITKMKSTWSWKSSIWNWTIRYPRQH